MDEIDIRFEPEQNRFVSQIGGKDCFVEYVESSGDRSWNVTHTWVAEELRGRGIAEKLMKALAAEALASNRKLTASCSYAATFFQRHKEYSNIMKT